MLCKMWKKPILTKLNSWFSVLVHCELIINEISGEQVWQNKTPVVVPMPSEMQLNCDQQIKRIIGRLFEKGNVFASFKMISVWRLCLFVVFFFYSRRAWVKDNQHTHSITPALFSHSLLSICVFLLLDGHKCQARRSERAGREVQPQLSQRLMQASVCVINHSGTLGRGTIHFYPSSLIPPSSLPLLLNAVPLSTQSAARHDQKSARGRLEGRNQ